MPVLGHEAVHALARHLTKRLEKDALASIPTIMAIKDEKKLSPEARGVIAAFGLGVLFSIDAAFSREQESEADREGFILAAQAGYDPDEAYGYWNRLMKCVGKDRLPEFLSSHPSSETRVKEIEALLGEARKVYKRAKPVEIAVLPAQPC